MSTIIQNPVPKHLQSEMIGGLTLKPSFSCPHQTAIAVAEKIQAYPKQELKNFGADSALTFADRTDPEDDRQIKNTLSQLFELEQVSHFFIYTKDGLIAVERLVDGNFFTTDICIRD
jgi:hypothetical protein